MPSTGEKRKQCEREKHRRWYLRNREKKLAANYARWRERYYGDPEFRAKFLSKVRSYQASKRSTMSQELRLTILARRKLLRLLKRRHRSLERGERKILTAARRKASKKAKILGILKASGDMTRFMHHRKRLLVMRRRQAARRRGIEFTVTAADLIWPEHCPALGVKLDYTTRGKVYPNMPSLDRIDLSKGYVPGNVAVISVRANTIKSNASLDELRSVANYVFGAIELGLLSGGSL